MHAARRNFRGRDDECDHERTGDGRDCRELDVRLSAETDAQADAHPAEEERGNERERDSDQRRERSAAASQRRRMNPENGPTANQ